VKEVMESHEIKKITEADIMSALDRMGLKVASEIDSVNCDARDSYARSMADSGKFTLEKVNAEGYASEFPKDRQMVEALAYEVEQGKAVNPTPQKLNDRLFAFYFTADCASEKSGLELWKLTIDRPTIIQSME
jgi:hypothetical protein